MDCSDVLKQGTKPLGVDVDGVAFLESTLDEISSICSNEADPIAPWANTSRIPVVPACLPPPPRVLVSV